MFRSRTKKSKSREKIFRVRNKSPFKCTGPAKSAQNVIFPGDSVLIEISGKELWILVVDHKTVNGRDYYRGIVNDSLNLGENPHIPNLVFSPIDIIQVQRLNAA